MEHTFSQGKISYMLLVNLIILNMPLVKHISLIYSTRLVLMHLAYEVLKFSSI